MAKRQANAAVAVLMVWPLLRHSPDPRGRSYLIHRLSPLGADPRAIVKRLDEEQDVSIRRALLSPCGRRDFVWRAEGAPARSCSTSTKTSPDPGLHGGADWLLCGGARRPRSRRWRTRAGVQEEGSGEAGG